MPDESVPPSDTATPPPPDDPIPGLARGASELGDVIERMAGHGYGADFMSALDGDSAELHCPVCDATHPASAFTRAWTARLEGASDPDDMLHVSALRCPECGTGGVFVSPFGVNVGEADEAVLLALPEAEGPPPAMPD